MDPITKIATCCYCGSRATLTLSGSTRHELACASCGAPLHEMRQIKKEVRPVARHKKTSRPQPIYKPRKEKPKKKRGFGYWLREVVDELEDFLD